MSNSDCQSIVSQTDKDIEPVLKDLLEKILLYLEKFIETKEDLQQVEAELKDYENLTCLVNIIKTIFNTLANKIDLRIIKLNSLANQDNLSHKSLRSEEEYEKLEQIIQRHEAEIRNHIRIEQQLKLYAESVQSKLEDSEKTRSDLLESTRLIINNIKRDNQKMSDNYKAVKEENDSLKERLLQIDKVLVTTKDENSQMQNKLNNQQILVKNYEKHNYNGNKHIPSYSEHKLLPYQNLDSQGDPSTDYPPQSMVSMKQNFLNPSNSISKPEVRKQLYQRTQANNEPDSAKQQNVLNIQRVYGISMLRSKQNSISDIKDMMNATLMEKRKIDTRKSSLIQSTLGVSKNTSLNNSVIAQKPNQQAFNTTDIRSKSQQGVTQSQSANKKQTTLLSNPLVKQRTEISKGSDSINRLWKFK